jgi:hypothetical protein
MLVKFEEDDKKQQPLNNTNIQEAIVLEKPDAEKEKYTPTEDELKKLEEELIKLNEQKFGTLEGPTGSSGRDGLMGEEINEPEKKVLNYLRRDA